MAVLTSSILRASVTMAREASPRWCAMNPTPHASRSLSGWYRPASTGGTNGFPAPKEVWASMLAMLGWSAMKVAAIAGGAAACVRLLRKCAALSRWWWPSVRRSWVNQVGCRGAHCVPFPAQGRRGGGVQHGARSRCKGKPGVFVLCRPPHILGPARLHTRCRLEKVSEPREYFDMLSLCINILLLFVAYRVINY